MRQPSGTYNILFVSERASNADHPLYLISRPFWELVNNHDALKRHITIHFCRPGSIERLKQLLERPRGFFSVVHLDIHGVVGSERFDFPSTTEMFSY